MASGRVEGEETGERPRSGVERSGAKSGALDERTARLEAQVAELSSKLDAATALSGLKSAASQLAGKEAKRQSFWNSPAGVALISLLGGMLILVWNAVSFHFDREAEGRKLSFERRMAAKGSLDETFGIYSGHAATICHATVRIVYLRLRQQHLLVPRDARAKAKAKEKAKAERSEACAEEVRGARSRTEGELERAQATRQKAFEYLAKVKEVEQPLSDVEAMFSAEATKQAASRFESAWKGFRELLRGDIQGQWKDALRAEAQKQASLETALPRRPRANPARRPQRHRRTSLRRARSHRRFQRRRTILREQRLSSS